MSRRALLLLVSGVLLALFLAALTALANNSDPTLSPQATSAATATTGEVSTVPPPTLSAEQAAETMAVDTVLAYWAAFEAGDGAGVGQMLDMSQDQAIKEVGLVEYSAAFGGEYEASCTAGAVLADEIAVDCEVAAVNLPLAEALGLAVTPTQFRVRGDRITRVGYLKPYSLIDLGLAAFVRPANEESFAESCSDPEGIYLADTGVVYNERCGAFMASFTDAYLVYLASDAACGPECDLALLSAIRASKD